MFFHGTLFYILAIVLVAGVLFSWKVYSADKNVKISVSGNEEVSKGDAVKIVFSSKMLTQSVEDGIKIEPALRIGMRWSGEQVLEVIPIETPLPDTQYSLVIENAKTKWLISQKDFKLTFNSPIYPTLTKVYPMNGQTDIEYSESITMEFDRPLADDFKLEVSISPLTGFSHSLNSAKTQLVIEPKESLEKETSYSVSATVKHREFEDESKEIYEGGFVTKTPPQVVYSLDRNGNPLKTEERKENVVATIKEGRSIEIDLSSQSLYIFENGKEIGAFKVSTGLRGMDTPQGTFKVISRARRPWSAKYKLYMPWFIQFTNEGHGIHELPEWPGGIKEGANHLGIPVSHGCVRLGIGPAKVVYDFAETGTPIVIRQ